ncbi:MAG: DUF1622 domain-containing protein [Janthinobacterium lividum]
MASFLSDLGRTILLGLEFLVAADIINTAAVEPTVRSVVVLAGIVLIRTLLSFSLDVEIDGRWPWQKPSAEDPASGKMMSSGSPIAIFDSRGASAGSGHELR